MKLKEYLDENDIGVAQFAALTEITYSSIYAYINETTRPSRLVARRIEEMTKGNVKAVDLRKITPIKKRKKHGDV